MYTNTRSSCSHTNIVGTWTVDALSSTLEAQPSVVRRHLGFWVGQGVLKEHPTDSFTVVEEQQEEARGTTGGMKSLIGRCLKLPYSRKLSREKTFALFTVLWLYAKVFSTKFWAWHPLARQKRVICESFLRENSIFHHFMKVFSLESFPLYGSLSYTPPILSPLFLPFLSSSLQKKSAYASFRLCFGY